MKLWTSDEQAAKLKYGEIGTWNVAKVTSMWAVFNGATSFDHDILTWNVASVTNMMAMFFLAKKFNRDLSAWNVARLRDMGMMFSGAAAFSKCHKEAILQNWPKTRKTGSMN